MNYYKRCKMNEKFKKEVEKYLISSNIEDISKIIKNLIIWNDYCKELTFNNLILCTAGYLTTTNYDDDINENKLDYKEKVKEFFEKYK